jgi:hypothetical protein
MTEMRMVIYFMALAFSMGFDWDDDGEPLYEEMGWAGRTLDKVLNRTYAELGFTLNPKEFYNLTQNPLPIVKLFLEAGYTITNTVDEFRDLLLGEDNPRDKTPFLYYGSKWIPGINQLRKIFDVFFEQDKVNQYRK